MRGPTSNGKKAAPAFTIIEIAISLAVVGFALLAIIGILPYGMNVQRDNRQETIIAQDATILMNAIRNGEHGLDDLTNYVMGITNYSWQFNNRGVPVTAHRVYYNYNGCTIDGSPFAFGISNGFRIVGLLSMPRIVPIPIANGGGFYSNHIAAYVRSMSGPASEKFPQRNTTVQDFGLSYRLIADITDYSTNYFDPSWTNFAGLTDTNQIVLRSNYMHLVWQYQTNLHDLRLTFRWPLQPDNTVNASAPRQVFRTTVSGTLLLSTNDPAWAFPYRSLYFFQPRNYAKAPIAP